MPHFRYKGQKKAPEWIPGLKVDKRGPASAGSGGRLPLGVTEEHESPNTGGGVRVPLAGKPELESTGGHIAERGGLARAEPLHVGAELVGEGRGFGGGHVLILVVPIGNLPSNREHSLSWLLEGVACPPSHIGVESEPRFQLVVVGIGELRGERV